MKTREYRTIEKAGWGAGPWLDEPDKIQFQDEATGLPCLVNRAHGGHWCGYVGVAEGHPCFGKSYQDIDVDVHGGLTFSEFCMEPDDESHGVCHVPDEGEPHRVWWLGFDCAHSGDMSPAHNKYHHLEDRHESYKDFSYVKAEIISLAQQLAAQKSV